MEIFGNPVLTLGQVVWDSRVVAHMSRGISGKGDVWSGCKLGGTCVANMFTPGLARSACVASTCVR